MGAQAVWRDDLDAAAARILAEKAEVHEVVDGGFSGNEFDVKIDVRVAGRRVVAKRAKESWTSGAQRANPSRLRLTTSLQGGRAEPVPIDQGEGYCNRQHQCAKDAREGTAHRDCASSGAGPSHWRRLIG